MVAEMDADERDEAYKIYVTECLRVLCGIKASYYDIVEPRPDFDAVQVVEHITSAAGLEVVS